MPKIQNNQSSVLAELPPPSLARRGYIAEDNRRVALPPRYGGGEGGHWLACMWSKGVISTIIIRHHYPAMDDDDDDGDDDPSRLTHNNNNNNNSDSHLNHDHQ